MAVKFYDISGNIISHYAIINHRLPNTFVIKDGPGLDFIVGLKLSTKTVRAWMANNNITQWPFDKESTALFILTFD